MAVTASPSRSRMMRKLGGYHRDRDDRRLVRVPLTPAGTRRITALGAAHAEEFHRLAVLATTARRTSTAAKSHPSPTDGGTHADGSR